MCVFCGSGLPLCQASSVCSGNVHSFLTTILIAGGAVLGSFRVWLKSGLRKLSGKNKKTKNIHE